MRKSRFTEQQISYALKQAETGTPVAEVIRKMGITEQTFYRWKKQYGEMGVGERRSCAALAFDRSSIRYQSIRAEQEPLLHRIRQFAQVRMRYGYFRMYIMLRREGVPLRRRPPFVQSVIL
mgnify:CR=1 FL=1